MSHTPLHRATVLPLNTTPRGALFARLLHLLPPGGCHSVVVTESAGLSRTSVPRGPVGPLSHPTGGIDCAGGDDATTRTTVVVVVVMMVVVVLGGYDGAGRPFLLDAPFHIETNPHNADH